MRTASATETDGPSTGGAVTMTNEFFGNAYQKGFQSTVRFLLSRGASYDAAIDTAQAAWTRGWERRAQLREPSLVATWTKSIALNIHRTALRSQRESEPLPELEAPPRGSITAAIDVERILMQCTVSERLVLEEHYIDGYKTREIAQKHGCSMTAVRIRLLRARRKVQSRVT